MSKGFKTTVQESKGKYTTSIPTALVTIMDLNKGDNFMWTMKDNKITIEVVKQ